jgi:hypothetical protein
MLKKAGIIAVASLGVASSSVAMAKDVRPAAVAFNTPVAASATQDVAAPARVRVAKRHDFLGLTGLPLLAVVGGVVAAGAVIGVVVSDNSSSPS